MLNYKIYLKLYTHKYKVNTALVFT